MMEKRACLQKVSIKHSFYMISENVPPDEYLTKDQNFVEDFRDDSLENVLNSLVLDPLIESCRFSRKPGNFSVILISCKPLKDH